MLRKGFSLKELGFGAGLIVVVILLKELGFGAGFIAVVILAFFLELWGQRKGTVWLGVFALPFLLFCMCPFSWLFRGCGSSSEVENPKGIAKAGAPILPPSTKTAKGKSEAGHDFTGLKGVLIGKWVRKTDSSVTLDFTGKSVELKNSRVGKYEIKGELLHITDTDRDLIVYGLEFLSEGEILLRTDARYSSSYFGGLDGHWNRVSLPKGMENPSVEKGPIAEAKSQVRKIELKLAKVEAILESALKDRDELASKLRLYGVKAPADLKNNIRGKGVADNLVKIAGEIEGLERQLVLLDTELLNAKTIVRRMEREQAGLSEEEMRNLAQQLREVEERTDGIRATPANAIDIDDAVEKALKAEGRPKKNK